MKALYIYIIGKFLIQTSEVTMHIFSVFRTKMAPMTYLKRRTNISETSSVCWRPSSDSSNNSSKLWTPRAAASQTWSRSAPACWTSSATRSRTLPFPRRESHATTPPPGVGMVAPRLSV